MVSKIVPKMDPKMVSKMPYFLCQNSTIFIILNSLKQGHVFKHPPKTHFFKMTQNEKSRYLKSEHYALCGPPKWRFWSKICKLLGPFLRVPRIRQKPPVEHAGFWKNGLFDLFFQNWRKRPKQPKSRFCVLHMHVVWGQKWDPPDDPFSAFPGQSLFNGKTP